jgi:hypothetical protein
MSTLKFVSTNFVLLGQTAHQQYWYGHVSCKGKVAPVLLYTEHKAMKACWGNGGITPLIL